MCPFFFYVAFKKLIIRLLQSHHSLSCTWATCYLHMSQAATTSCLEAGSEQHNSINILCVCVWTRTHQYKQKEVLCVHNNSILQLCSSFFPNPSACYTLLAMLRLAELCGMPSCATMDVFFSPVFEICVAQCDREQSKFSKLMWSCCSRCSGMSYFNTVWVRCAVMPKKPEPAPKIR